jgi:predicted RNA binding protein YcfA (HicA-like mRNA interferase family)
MTIGGAGTTAWPTWSPMPRVPRITGKQALRALVQAGWRPVRQRGSHVVLRHRTHPGRVVVPVHAGVVLKSKTLASILDQAGIRMDKFMDRGI